MSNCLSEKCNTCPIGFICNPRIIPNGIECKQFGKLWKKTLLQSGHSTEQSTGNNERGEISLCSHPNLHCSYKYSCDKPHCGVVGKCTKIHSPVS
jgi:hypothetical protein